MGAGCVALVLVGDRRHRSLSGEGVSSSLPPSGGADDRLGRRFADGSLESAPLLRGYRPDPRCPGTKVKDGGEIHHQGGYGLPPLPGRGGETKPSLPVEISVAETAVAIHVQTPVVGAGIGMKVAPLRPRIAPESKSRYPPSKSKSITPMYGNVKRNLRPGCTSPKWDVGSWGRSYLEHLRGIW